MFENRTERELIVIYAIIGIVVALILAAFKFSYGVNIYYIIIAANIEFFCVFYILYLPIKVKKAREKQEKTKK
jgi:hypothetical protein